jgi:recombination protein RecT
MATKLEDLRNSNAGHNAVDTTRPYTVFDMLKSDKVRGAIATVVGKHMNADRFTKLAILAVQRTPRLMQCNPQSVLGAIMASATLKLEPNTPLGQAYLIPYKRRSLQDDKWVDTWDCQFQIGYRGYHALALRSDVVAVIESEAIREGDVFERVQGSKSFLTYQKALQDRGDLIGAFCYVRLTNGGEQATVLPRDEVFKSRDRSETWKALRAAVEDAGNDKDRAKAAKKLAETPWELWDEEMFAKTASKKHFKRFHYPEARELAAALSIDDATENGSLDLAAMSDPDVSRDVILGREEPPEVDGEELKAIEQQRTETIPKQTANAEPIATKAHGQRRTFQLD